MFEFIAVNGGKFLSTLFATGFGAYAAFKYRELEDKKKQRRARIAALKIAQGAIHSQWSAMLDVQKFFRTRQAPKENGLNLEESIQEHGTYFVDIPSIAFLLDGKFADLVQEIILVEGTYRTMKKGLERRSEMIRRFREKMEADEIELKLYRQLDQSIRDSVDEGCNQSKSAFEALDTASREIFGTRGLGVVFTKDESGKN